MKSLFVLSSKETKLISENYLYQRHKIIIIIQTHFTF